MTTYYVAAHPDGGMLLRREKDQNYQLYDNGLWRLIAWHADPMTWAKHGEEKWQITQVDPAVIQMLLFEGDSQNLVPTPCCT